MTTTALFVSGVIVCFPPLVVLGMYSPLAVRLLLREPSDAGKISGGLFAISSVGNIVGIIVTTFYLIPTIGSRAITGGFAAFLLVSGLVSVAGAAKPTARLTDLVGGERTAAVGLDFRRHQAL